MKAEEYKGYLEHVGNDPGSWELEADALLISSRVLRKTYESGNWSEVIPFAYAPEELYVRESSLLLRGYGVECLLKAIFLRKVGKLFEGDGPSDKHKQSFAGAQHHRLDQMAGFIGNRIGIQWQGEEIDLLHRLSHYVRVSGRYPVPNRNREQTTGGWVGADEPLFEQILEKLRPHHGSLKFHGDKP